MRRAMAYRRAVVVSQTWDFSEEDNVVGSELLTVVATVDSGTGATVLTLTGEVDMLTAPVLRQGIDEQFSADLAPIIVDLSRVEFFGSTALDVMVKTQQRASAEGRDFLLVAGTRVVRRPLEVTGLDAVLSVYDDLDLALEAVRASAAHRPHHGS
jgi:anti-sigma B factor antagonist